MKDRTIDYSRQDAGETMKDIKTKGNNPSVHSSYEKNENYTVDELASKVASLLKRAQAAVPQAKDTEDKPTPEEYVRRQERMRKLLGMIIGGGYGTIAGGVAGGELFGRGPGFDRATALKSALAGLLTGGSLGYGAGTALNKIKRYTGENNPATQTPTIQIVVPPSAQVVRNVEDAMKSGSATARTVAIFAGIGV